MSERKSNGWIRLRGKIWWITIRKDGKEHATSTRGVFGGAYNDGTSKTVAEAMLRGETVDVSRGALPTAVAGKITWEHLRESYLNRNPEQRLRSAVARMRHLDDFFDGMTAAEVNNVDNIFKFQNQLRSQKKLADPTIRRISVLLRAILNRAKKDGKLQQYSVVDVPMPKDSKPRQGFTTAETFSKILALLPESCRALATFQFRTGCRTGAALAITWNMVSKNCDEIELPGEITKSGKPLTLPLVGDGLEDIAKQLRKQFRNPHGKVFNVGQESYRYNWNKACGQLGLGIFNSKTRTYSGLRPHDLRRTAIKNMMRSGVDRNTAMSISGHRTEAVFNRYHIVETSDIRRALEQTGEAEKIAK